FGEIGPVFGLPRSATVRARTDATVTGYSVPAFRQQLSAGTAHRPLEGREPALD
ncbi:MAG: glutamine ABC transporter ATP-binding protein, partial [Mycobacterium sp.]|nr:glutamine ABC transporter ATP-binding protein [Mycobacterium sp.]